MNAVEKILYLMEVDGVNAKKLTSDLKLAVSSVTDWKKGKAKPSVEAIVKISKYFNVTTDYLLTDGVLPIHTPMHFTEAEIIFLNDCRERVLSGWTWGELASAISHLSNEKEEIYMGKRYVTRAQVQEGLAAVLNCSRAMELDVKNGGQYRPALNVLLTDEKIAEIADKSKLSEDKIKNFAVLAFDSMDMSVDEDDYPTAHDYRVLVVTIGKRSETTDEFQWRLEEEEKLIIADTVEIRRA